MIMQTGMTASDRLLELQNRSQAGAHTGGFQGLGGELLPQLLLIYHRQEELGFGATSQG